VKILKVKSRKYKGTQYYKYRVSALNEELLKKSGLKPGDKLEGEARSGKIIFRKEKV